MQDQNKVQSARSTDTSRNSRNAALANCKIGDQMQARIVTCTGDPGLTEPFFFDILSRFLIVMYEPCDIVPTNSNLLRHFALVKRPRHLWIDCPAAPDLTPSNQQGNTRRKDYLGNINIGSTANYTINTIPQMDTEYTVGESITIRRIPKEYSGQSTIFNSQFSNVDFSNYYNGPQFAGAHLQGWINTHGQSQFENYRKNYNGLGGNKLNEVMDWSSAHWTSHGSGLKEGDLAPADRYGKNRGPQWYKLKPLYRSGKIYSNPVKPMRVNDDGYLVPGETEQRENKKGAIVPGTINPRMTGTISPNNFFMILHYYLVDSFLREQFPEFDVTLNELRYGVHRFQRYNGHAKNRNTGAPITSENLFPTPNESVWKNGSKAQRLYGQPTQDKSFLNKNILFSFCEWEDTNQGNKQRNTRDECMPLVIASPNNFPTPKERKIGSILYQPAYAKVVAAQTPEDPPDPEGEPEGAGGD